MLIMNSLAGIRRISLWHDARVAAMARKFVTGFAWLVLLCSAGPVLAQRINHEGRILGPLPVVTNALLFNTPEADRVLAAMQIMPVDNPWNEDVSGRPVLSNSAPIISQIYNDLASNRRTLRVFKEMNFVLVPDSQPPVPIAFVDYPDESDPGPYPIPANMPIEGWPTEAFGQTLYQWQTDANNIGGDRHAIVVQPGSGLFWETWQAKLVGSNWQASNGARFDLTSNGLRPAGWTSGDAAGLPMFAGLIRYDECERGAIEHAVRLVVRHTRAQYIYPARHYASSPPYSTNPSEPAMGQRLRLKAGFPVPPGWTKQEKAVMAALKKYGGMVADNGNFFSVSAVPDDRFPAGAFDNLATVSVTNFEVVATTGPSEGPRSPGKPSVDAGPDRTVDYASPVNLEGGYSVTGGTPTVSWQLYDGPADVTFSDAALTNTDATFHAPGRYTLVLCARDGVHAPAYDAVVINVRNNLRVTAAPSGTNLAVSWQGAYPPFVIEKSTDLLRPLAWTAVLTNTTMTAVLPCDGAAGFFRVQGN